MRLEWERETSAGPLAEPRGLEHPAHQVHPAFNLGHVARRSTCAGDAGIADCVVLEC